MVGHHKALTMMHHRLLMSDDEEIDQVNFCMNNDEENNLAANLSEQHRSASGSKKGVQPGTRPRCAGHVAIRMGTHLG